MPAVIHPRVRATVFAPRLAALIGDHLGARTSSAGPDTVGVAAADASPTASLAPRAGRPETERPTSNRCTDSSITRSEAVRGHPHHRQRRCARPRARPLPEGRDPCRFCGRRAGHLFPARSDTRPGPLPAADADEAAPRTHPQLTWSVIAVGAALPGWPRPKAPGSPASPDQRARARGYQERRYAVGMYRRAAAPLCFTVSTPGGLTPSGSAPRSTTACPLTHHPQGRCGCCRQVLEHPAQRLSRVPGDRRPRIGASATARSCCCRCLSHRDPASLGTIRTPSVRSAGTASTRHRPGLPALRALVGTLLGPAHGHSAGRAAAGPDPRFRAGGRPRSAGRQGSATGPAGRGGGTADPVTPAGQRTGGAPVGAL
ncbi:hypothetical protein LT493_44040 [Streptomyces tricolor]|nr:hypothetical protein [Streptomyces tricolor]